MATQSSKAPTKTKSHSRSAKKPVSHETIDTAIYSRYPDDESHFAITIGVRREEVFEFCRDFGNLPAFMKNVKAIEVRSERDSHWVVEIKDGVTAEWDTEIISERPNEMIAWKSVKGSEIEASGAIYFSAAPQDRGTVVSLTLNYKTSGGKLAEMWSYFTGDHPEELAFVNLRRLKARMETGEIPTIDGQPSGREARATVEPIVTHH